MAPTSRHCFPYRPHDFMYDPIFTVSGPIDHYKAVKLAKMSVAKFQICPIFPNMFSDLPTHPRIQLVKRRQKKVPTYTELQESKNKREKDPYMHREVDVRGSDRSKFHVSVMNFPPSDALPFQTAPTFTIENVESEVVIMDSTTKDLEVQTMYRESDAQTDPWEPPYKIVGDHTGDPEILKLAFLKWGSGLPAGLHEVQLIERARMKIAWEKHINPNFCDKESIQQFRDYVQALEIDEWAFRERQISEVQTLRLQLLENMLNEIHQASDNRNMIKMNNVMERVQAEKDKKIADLKKKTSREIRKLELQRRGYNPRYHEVSIIDEHANKKSELYAPLMRHGEHPKRWHLVIDEKLKEYRAQFAGVENLDTLPPNLEHKTIFTKQELYSTNRKLETRRLCIRRTKWVDPVLKVLYEELKDLRKGAVRRPLSLRTKVKVALEESHTPEVEGIQKSKETVYQAVLVLQKVIKGRASQARIYEGRDTCKELIQELKHSKGLMKTNKGRKRKEKFKVKNQQRQEMIQMKMVQRLQGSLSRLQGVVIGSLLDFLNKELRRLLEERKIHAMCLMNERERYAREAVEAGRRQKELRRRREHDEMFKQLVKISQESVDIYLKDIITEGMDFCSKEEASEYVHKLATKIDTEAEENYEVESSIDEQDEIIANLILHFLLPDVNKKIIREKMANMQKGRLKSIHDEIYSNFENLPAPVYPETPPEEIIHGILEDIKNNVDKELDIKYDLTTEVVVDEDILSQTMFTTDDQSQVGRKSEVSARTEVEFTDPVEVYMSQLMNEIGDDEYEEGFHMRYQEHEDLFKNATLATIPEVDNENSVKE